MMKKFCFIGALLVFLSVAKSQETLKSALLDINKNANVLDGLIANMESGLKKDKHNDLERLSASIEKELSTINQKLLSLNEADQKPIGSLINLYNTDVDNFQKLTRKSGLLDKDKLLDKAFEKIKNRQAELRDLLKSAYIKALHEEEQKKNENTPEQKKDTVVNGQPMNKASSNSQVLQLIAESKQTAELYVDSAHLAMKKNNFPGVSKYARLISNSCLQIEDLSLLLQSDHKQSIGILAGGLKSYSDELQKLAKKGAAAHHQMHDLMEKMEIKFNSLSTGLSLIQ